MKARLRVLEEAIAVALAEADDAGSDADDWRGSEYVMRMAESLAANGYRLVPEPAPDVEALDVGRLAEAMHNASAYMSPGGHGRGPRLMHRPFYITAEEVAREYAALHPADPSRREPG